MQSQSGRTLQVVGILFATITLFLIVRVQVEEAAEWGYLQFAATNILCGMLVCAVIFFSWAGFDPSFFGDAPDDYEL